MIENIPIPCLINQTIGNETFSVNDQKDLLLNKTLPKYKAVIELGKLFDNCSIETNSSLRTNLPEGAATETYNLTTNVTFLELDYSQRSIQSH